MPTGTRIRDNNVYGLTTDNPLTAGAVTFNSIGLANMSAVIANHAVVTLDPLREFGEPEIVVVTTHTAAATVATITRGQYGTVARSHPQNTTWVMAPLDEDFIEILTSGTRPSNPYEGQFIFEADTNKLVGYGGVDWAPRDAGGQLGYAQAIVDQTPITTVVDLTNLSVAVVAGTGRRLHITGKIEVSSTVAGDIPVLTINEGATQFQRHTGRLSGTAGETWIVSAVLTPSAGAHTYKLTLVRAAGTGNLTMSATSTQPAFILVEDIGAA